MQIAELSRWLCLCRGGDFFLFIEGECGMGINRGFDMRVWELGRKLILFSFCYGENKLKSEGGRWDSIGVVLWV